MITVRVAVVAETFHPVVNGVSNSVARVLEHLGRSGHESLVIAPGPGPDCYRGVPVLRVRSFRPPMYRSVHVAWPGAELVGALRDFEPDVMHLASPALLGLTGARAARQVGVPAVAVFQTDLAAYMRRYHLSPISRLVWRQLRGLHGLCALTLAPSSAVAWSLARHAVAAGRPVRIALHPADLDRPGLPEAALAAADLALRAGARPMTYSGLVAAREGGS